MPAYIRKNSGEVLREALEKIQQNTPITSISPGSVMRALTEAITTEVGDLYDIMDYNLNQNLLSTATGSALDHLGSLYDVERKTVNNLAVIDKQLGSFYFYLQTPALVDILIPAGIRVFTDAASFVGRRYSYTTSDVALIIAGRTKAYVGLNPSFTDTVFTAGPKTLILHDFQSPVGTTVFCTNPKEIAQQITFEADNAYRLRIIKNLKVQTGGTIQAMRFAVLGVPGVRDVKIRQAPYGMGSFEGIIVPERNGTGSTSQIMSAATIAMEIARPLGVRMYVKQPTTVAMDISVELVMPGAGISTFAETAVRRAEVGMTRYVNSLLPGNPFVYNRIISIILESSDLVKDAIIKSLTINGLQVMRKNYQPADDEQIIPGTITASIATP